MTETSGLSPAELLDLKTSISINQNAIVSKTLRKSAGMNLTLFAFDEDQGLSGHSSPMDAYVQVLSGRMKVTIGDHTSTLEAGQMILMPATVNHALEALAPSKMLLTMVSVEKL